MSAVQVAIFFSVVFIEAFLWLQWCEQQRAAQVARRNQRRAR